jgi:hyperosmotically inducible protein
LFCYPYFSDYPVANKKEAPKRPENDDTAITAKVKADILGDPLLKVAQINVTTTNGVFALNGVVHSQQSIDRATGIVQSVK